MGKIRHTLEVLSKHLRAFPLVVLLIPLVAFILICDRFYPLHQPWHKTPPNPTQTALYQRLADAGLSGDELATVGALTLGYKEELSKDLRHHFQASGAAHVLAVSGLHTGILYGLLIWLLTLGGRFRPMHENRFGRCALSLVIIAAMWAYAWLTGLTPSVVRAVLMVTIFEIGRMFYRQSLSINTVSAAAVLILLFHPSDLWSVSFQLSFAATFVIIVLARYMERHLPHGELRNSDEHPVLRWIIGTVIVSLAAQLGTLGISMYYFHQVSCYFLLTNLIVLPIATVLVPCGLGCVALGGSSIGILLGYPTAFLAQMMNRSVEWIESLPGSTVEANVSLPMVGVYYGLLLGLMLFLPNKWQKTT